MDLDGLRVFILKVWKLVEYMKFNRICVTLKSTYFYQNNVTLKCEGVSFKQVIYIAKAPLNVAQRKKIWFDREYL